MCRYCPPSAIVCLEPADEPAPRCAWCTEEPAAERPDAVATREMAEHARGLAEGAPLCLGCFAMLREDLAQLGAEAAEAAREAARIPCALCERREDPEFIDHVDVLGGTASVPVCHGCQLAVFEDLMGVADRARDAWIDRMELDADLAGPLPTEGDFVPANDCYDAGDAA